MSQGLRYYISSKPPISVFVSFLQFFLFILFYRPIYADYKKDTADTIRQIDDNNVVYDTICNRN